MKLIVGLGNPGARYENTRHNLGFRVVDELSRRYSISTKQEKFHAWFGSGVVGCEQVVLAKPTTFMNLSGQAVLALVQFYACGSNDLLIIADDMALPLGKLRFRARGSAGGHNGLADIIQRLGTEEINRLRFGIGSAAFDAVDHVLSSFSMEEQPIAQAVIPLAAEAVVHWVESGIEAAMNQYNPDPQTDERTNR